VLDLSHNALRELPVDFGSCLPALQQLYLASNDLRSLPESLSAAALVDLFASENGFGAFPGAVAGCGRLEKLSLAACGLRGELPAEVGSMGALRCVGAIRLWIAWAARRLGNRMATAGLLQLPERTMHPHMLFPRLCAALDTHSHTHSPPPRFLDVSFNELTGVTPALAGCSSLTALNLGYNPLGAALPPVLCALSGLVELNVDYTGWCCRCCLLELS